jgi:glycosyltransferase involved in cell wall biosynthesis
MPSYNEPYLLNTINCILDNAEGDIEIFVNVDDGQQVEFARNDSRVTFNYPNSPLGMRGGINKGLAQAQGKYIMKCDAHCVFDKGFDTIITEQMEDDWLVIPRRYPLNADGWTRDKGSIAKDYHYFVFPTTSRYYGTASFPLEWRERRIARKDYQIDDTMSMQGSCYIANKKYFMKQVGFLDDRPETYNTFPAEQLEVGLKYWLKGGAMKVNKNTWYAHLFKNSRYYKEVAGEESRRYKVRIKANSGWEWSTKHWMNNEEPGQIHSFSWLIEKFWPVPSWPEDRNLWVFPK